MDYSSTDSTLYARQRIFDRDLSPAGEELLYRERPYPNRAPASFDPDRATSRVLVNAFMRDPHPTFNPRQPAFVNFAAAMLARQLPFPADQLVVEVLESVRPSAATISQIKRLKQRGFRIALDDYARHDADHPLIAHADIIKLEYPAFRTADIPSVIARLKARKPELQILVEKIETQHDIGCARAAGCDLLQGYGLHKPEPVFAPAASIATADLHALRAALSNPRRLAKTLAKRPALAAHLARLAGHWQPARADQHLSARQTIDIITPARLGPILDLMDTAQPAPSQHPEPAAQRQSPQARPRLRNALAGLTQNLWHLDGN